MCGNGVARMKQRSIFHNRYYATTNLLRYIDTMLLVHCNIPHVVVSPIECPALPASCLSLGHQSSRCLTLTPSDRLNAL